MKKLLVLGLVFVLAAQMAAQAADRWLTDFPAALAQAKKEKKLVLVDFTGSDWCSWCKKLDKEVFSTWKFKSYAKKNLVLVEIDFPEHKKQSEELKKANEALEKKYNVDGYPTILVFDGDGNELWRQSYMEGGAKAWIAKLESLKK